VVEISLNVDLMTLLLKLDGLLVVVELLQSDEEFGEDVVNA
jgi:hypothetical protein